MAENVAKIATVRLRCEILPRVLGSAHWQSRLLQALRRGPGCAIVIGWVHGRLQ